MKSLKKVWNEQKRLKNSWNKFFDQLLGARSTQKLVEIHNNCGFSRKALRWQMSQLTYKNLCKLIILSPWLRPRDLGFLGWMCPFPSNWTGVNIISQKGESERSEWERETARVCSTRERDYISLALLLQPFFQPTMMQLHWESARERERVCVR